jgi:AraC-like DNA-binding protein
MIHIEVREAMRAAGCTDSQILAAIEAEEHRLLVRRLVRRALRALRALDPSPVLERQKRTPESAIAPIDGIRSAPAKAAARGGIVSSQLLKPAARLVAARLVEHHNMETGRCDPSVGRLARDLGLSERSVRRAIVELQGLRLLTRHVHAGRGLTNGYVLDLRAMAALTETIGRKADSSENRTLLAESPDRRVRQNDSQKQSQDAAREPLQRELRLFRSIPTGGERKEIARSSARRRIHADIADAAEAGEAINVSTLTDADWSAADLAEVRRQGRGLGVIRDRLGTGPPKAASG